MGQFPSSCCEETGVKDDFRFNKFLSPKMIEDSEIDNEGSFLTFHKFDGEEKWLLSQNDIASVLAYQASEVKRLEEQNQIHSSDECILDDKRTDITFDSSYGSETFSALTVKVQNMNKYAARHQFRARTRVQKIVNSSKTVDRYGSNFIPEEDDWDCNESPGSVNDTNINDSTNSLRLKMKANMVDVYRDEFLMMFPEYPLPKDMSMRKVTFQSNWKNASQRTFLHNSNASKHIFFPGATPILLSVNNTPFLNLILHGCIGLVDRPSISKKRSLDKKKLKDFLILADSENGRPVAVCALKSRRGQPIVRIFSTKPITPDQQLAADTSQLQITKDPIPLYAWAEFEAEGQFPEKDAKYLLHISTGIEGKFEKNASYIAHHIYPGSAELKIIARTEAEEQHSGCGLVSIITGSNICDQETYFELSIARGVDPALLICMTGIIDELLEGIMRKKCAMNAWKFASAKSQVSDGTSA